MVVFIDTSSLIKRYIEEVGSSIIDIYYSDETVLYLAPITHVEIISALKRKVREGSISEQTYKYAIDSWHEDLISYSIIEFNDVLISKAIDIVNDYNVKTLDALQIGSALLSKADEYVTSDRQMHRVFEEIDDVKSVFI